MIADRGDQMKEQIVARIAELIKQRDQFVAQANVELAAYAGRIAENERWLAELDGAASELERDGT